MYRMDEKEQLHVLIVEDDEDDFFISSRLLSKTIGIECEVEWARTYDEGLQRVTSHEFDVALIDYRLDSRNGLDLLREAISLGCETPMILLTGQGDLRTDLEAMAAGAADYLVKGKIDSQLLERSIRYARERKRAEERIREQAAFLEKARDAISAYDLDRRVIYWNRSAERMTGHPASHMLGRVVDADLYENDSNTLEKAWESVQEKGEWSGELKQKRKSGNPAIVESRWTLVRDALGNPRSVLVINTDVTERKELEIQFLRSQRMESIGSLVGGIAHDLGNLLVPVLLGVQVLEKRFEEDPNARRTLEMIGRSAQRGSEMVKHVLAFARGVEGERVPVAPDTIIREVQRITEDTFPQNLVVDVHVGDDLWKVKGDATQLQQVLMNLCVNARDAMPDGGKLNISAVNTEVGDDIIRTNIDAERGPHVCLTITDTGTGIPLEVRDKMFEPFFTTKKSGKGTGLGLSTVYSIVKGHSGFMSVQSSLGEGTTFKIYLPAADEFVGESAQDSEDADVSNGNDEVVLIVDDEEYVLELMRETLVGVGYQVLTAATGRDALDLVERRDDVDAIITDLMMPEIDGIALIKEFNRLRPGVPVIVASGLSGDDVSRAIDAGATAFLSKPFTGDRIHRVLKGVLHTDDISDTV